MNPRPNLKRKGNEEVPNWVHLMDEERCAECRRKSVRFCVVDLAKIKRWEAGVAAGKKFAKVPRGVGCQECKVKRHQCLLPRTMSLREALSGDQMKGKRKRAKDASENVGQVEVEGEAEQPAPKKLRMATGLADETALLEVGSRLLEVLAGYLQEQKRSTDACERIAYLLEYMADGLEQK